MVSWDALSVERVIELVQYWVNQDWPLMQDKVSAAMAGVGWVMGEDGRWQADSVPLARQNLSAVAGYEEKGLDHISWNVTDVVLGDSPERTTFMNNAFAVFTKKLSMLYGKAKRKRQPDFVSAQWDTFNGCRLKMVNRYSAVGIDLYSSNYSQILRNSDRR
ncbi:MAG: DUF6301 family protein [Propionibacteriaceae bacterium]|nr:DUF6301 family protein [Propionibacteriaceae bacterium]